MKLRILVECDNGQELNKLSRIVYNNQETVSIADVNDGVKDNTFVVEVVASDFKVGSAGLAKFAHALFT